jgi:hypothetical protein
MTSTSVDAATAITRQCSINAGFMGSPDKILRVKNRTAEIRILPYPNILSLSFLWFDSANGIAVRRFCLQQSSGTGFSIDHREGRQAEGAEPDEHQQLCERPEPVLSLLPACIRLIL